MLVLLDETLEYNLLLKVFDLKNLYPFLKLVDYEEAADDEEHDDANLTPASTSLLTCTSSTSIVLPATVDEWIPTLIALSGRRAHLPQGRGAVSTTRTSNGPTSLTQRLKIIKIMICPSKLGALCKDSFSKIAKI